MTKHLRRLLFLRAVYSPLITSPELDRRNRDEYEILYRDSVFFTVNRIKLPLKAKMEEALKAKIIPNSGSKEVEWISENSLEVEKEYTLEVSDVPFRLTGKVLQRITIIFEKVNRDYYEIQITENIFCYLRIKDGKIRARIN
jgi:hypothetical protein